jgi:hypothetical protein
MAMKPENNNRFHITLLLSGVSDARVSISSSSWRRAGQAARLSSGEHLRQASIITLNDQRVE